MLIDDDKSANYLNEMVIEEAECANHVVLLHSGEDAIRYLGTSALEAQFCPELIFLDINMPGMDGWEFIEAYRGLESGSCPEAYSPFVVMLTSSLNPEDEERAKKIKEISDYRHKPVTIEMIQDILEQNFSS